MKRAVELVKPGEWLIVEDADYMLHGDEMNEASKRVMKAVHDYLHLYGAEPVIGPLLEGIIKDTGFMSGKSLLLSALK